jgi:putative membrane protein
MTVPERAIDEPWRRSHPLGALIIALKTFPKALPALFLIAQTRLVAAVIPIVLVLVWRVAHWYTTTYRLTSNEIVVRSGVFNRTVRAIPSTRVQGVSARRGLLQRALGVASVRIDVAGTNNHVELHSVCESEAYRIRTQLHPTITASSANATNPDVPTVMVVLPPPERTILKLTSRQIVLGALTGAGLLSAPLGVLALVQLLDEADLMPGRLPVIGPAAAILLGLVALIAVPFAAALVSLARNGGWHLTESAGELRIQRGLTDHRTSVIPVHRVVRVTSSANPLRQALGLAAVDITTAAPPARGDNEGVGSADDDIPIVPAAELVGLEQLLVPASATVGELNAHPRTALRRSILRRFCPVVPLAVGIALLTPAVGLIVLVAGAAMASVIGSIEYRRLRYGVSATALVAESGRLGWKRQAVALVKVQSVSVTQSPFQRRAGLATLVLDLALTRVRVRDIDHAEAFRIAGLVRGITLTPRPCL